MGTFVGALLDHLARRPDLDCAAYGLTWRGRKDLAAAVPEGVRACQRPMAARPLREAWRRFEGPPVELWTGPVDVVHGTNFVVPPTRRAAAVVTVHDLTSLRFPELCDAATLVYPAMLRRAIARGAMVHSVSRFVADEVVADLGADPDRVVVVHSGTPSVPVADPAAGRALAGAERYVLALGTVEPRKDLPLLVRAFDSLAGHRPELRLVIAGQDGWGAQALSQAIAQAGHRHQVVRLGWVDARQRAGLLRGASVLAYPSRYEGFGFPPLEAMTVGVPVVASDAGALPEVLGDAAVLVPVGDVDALAKALATVLDDPERQAVFVEAGHRRVRRYDWARTAEHMVALYQRAAGERG